MSTTRRPLTRAQGYVFAAVCLGFAILFAAGCAWILIRTGGDLSTTVGSGGSGRNSLSLPAGVAIGIFTALSVIIAVFGVYGTVRVLRMAKTSESAPSEHANRNPR